MNNYVPKMTNGINTPKNTGFISGFEGNVLDGIQGADKTQKSNFKDVMTNLTQDLNNTVNAPDQLLQDSLTGKADIHDVIIAMNKAELGVNIATQLTTKIVQSYEKIMAIQV